MRSREVGALIGFAAVLAITATWWGLALWPLGSGAPAWIVRAQAVCFGTQTNGLPDASGWLALILQPAIMFTSLAFIAGDAVVDGVRSAFRLTAGRIAIAAVIVAGVLGIGAATHRVRSAPTWDTAFSPWAPIPDNYPRLNRPAPRLDLVNQHGEQVSLDALVGRPVLVTFGFAHCETVCPLVVSDVLKACDQMTGQKPVAVVLTLDPWRDTPSRLPAIARQWGLSDDALVVSGSVEQVERALDAWNVARSRDLSTGDITHPRLVYIIDADGRIAYATTGGVDAIVELVGRL